MQRSIGRMVREMDAITDCGLFGVRLYERLFPEEEAFIKTLEIRKNPLAYKDRADVKAWLSALGPTVQRCADVPENELRRCSC